MQSAHDGALAVDSHGGLKDTSKLQSSLYAKIIFSGALLALEQSKLGANGENSEIVISKLYSHRNSSNTISGRAPMRSGITEVPMPRETYKSPQAVW